MKRHSIIGLAMACGILTLTSSGQAGSFRVKPGCELRSPAQGLAAFQAELRGAEPVGAMEAWVAFPLRVYGDDFGS